MNNEHLNLIYKLFVFSRSNIRFLEQKSKYFRLQYIMCGCVFNSFDVCALQRLRRLVLRRFPIPVLIYLRVSIY